MLSILVPHVPAFPPLPPGAPPRYPDDGGPPWYCPDTQSPQVNDEPHAIWVAPPATTSIGPGAGRRATGTARDRGVAEPGGNLTDPAPIGADLEPPREPGEIAPDSRPLRDRGLLDGTRRGPAQPQ
jgi:hypothetical protein